VSRVRTATVRVPRRGTVSARHEWGSTYVDLYFGYADEPYETINVGNDEGHVPDVRTVVTAWVKEMDSDPSWPTWYEDILAATQQ
jgi:hypothetical protein